MTSFKISIIFILVAMTTIKESFSKQSSKRDDPNLQNLFLGQIDSDMFLDKRNGYGYGYDNKENKEDIEQHKTANRPKTWSTPSFRGCDQQCGKNLCRGSKKNQTIHLCCGKKVVCVVPSDEELLTKLNKIGGYNRHYVALNLKEAEENFDDLLKPYKQRDRPCSGKGKIVGHPLYGWCNDSYTRFKRSVSCGKPQCVKAGEVLRNGNKMTCSLCQKCNELSSDFFPRFLNEIVCGNELTKSTDPPLSCSFKGRSLGMCSQRTMTIDVLTKKAEDYELVNSDGSTTIYKQVWTSATKEIRTCCECMDT